MRDTRSDVTFPSCGTHGDLVILHILRRLSMEDRQMWCQKDVVAALIFQTFDKVTARRTVEMAHSTAKAIHAVKIYLPKNSLL